MGCDREHHLRHWPELTDNGGWYINAPDECFEWANSDVLLSLEYELPTEANTVKRYKLNGKEVQAAAAAELSAANPGPQWLIDRLHGKPLFLLNGVELDSRPRKFAGHCDAIVLLDGRVYVLPLSALTVETVDRSPGGLIREARERKGWSQQELARKASVADKCIKLFEQGEPNSFAMYKVNYALGFADLTYLEGYHDGWHAAKEDSDG